MSSAHALREQIFLVTKETTEDDAGGLKEETRQEDSFRWAHIKPLSPFHEGPLGAKALKARSPSGPMSQERYEITLRDKPDIPEIHRILWKNKALIPQSYPQGTRADFVSFQAVVYQNTNTESE